MQNSSVADVLKRVKKIETELGVDCLSEIDALLDEMEVQKLICSH